MGNITGEKKSGLNDFLAKFNSSQGKYVDTIDTLNTFDVKFMFSPCVPKPDDSGGSKILDKAGEFGMGLLNNIIGGLAGQIKNAFSDSPSLDELKEKVNDGTTIMDYILEGNLIDHGSKPLIEWELTYYAQQMTLPNIIMKEESTVDTMFGDFPINGKFVKPSTNTFQIDVINTKSPLLEKLFYPWMREVTLPYWSYDEQPYTTAIVIVDFKKHADMKYVFVGCRPNSINTVQPSNELNGSITRQVSFIFDYMFVHSNEKTQDTFKDSAKSIGTSLLNSAGSMIGL